MCGIAGILAASDAAAPAPSELRRMAAALAHRGPDGYGTYVDERSGLAHTRLAILDRAGGDQPLGNEDGTVWITFNGEIFNYLELRAELEARGHRFRTRSDTEVIVHAYEEWSDDAWRRLNGQFAFAIRDLRDRSLWLVRDRVGIAPLFLARTPQAVLFGSEAKAILASRRVRAEADPAALVEAFTLWATPGPSTVFAGITIVAPGTALRFDERLGLRSQVYHRQRFEVSPEYERAAPEALAEELEARLRTATSLRLRADVPVGAYLSGGLDSSVVTSLVRTIDTSPLETFSVRFEDARYDEGEAQGRMARELATSHHEIVATPALLASELPRVIAHCEAPLLRTAPVPMFLLSGLVRRQGMRVVLTGEGADEFLGGYDLFKEARVRRFWARQPNSRARPMLLSRIHPYVANAGSGAMWQAFFRRGLDRTDDPFYAHRLRWENAAWATRFLAPEVRAALSPTALDDRLRAVLPDDWDTCGPLERAQLVEIATFMSPYLLASQGDRALMANAVEGRFPFLDPNVIDFCSALPARRKLCGLREKTTLRRVARRLLPPEVAERRKWPYRAPIARALFGPAAPEFVRELLGPAALAASPLIDATAAGSLAARAWTEGAQLGEREEMALVGLLTLQLWQRTFLGAADLPSAPREPRVAIDRRTAARADAGP
jgi:asparagine synthase (glutamine-hydrolysing)